MGIFDNLSQGFMPAVRNNSDALLQTGLGLLSGKTGPEQAALAAQGFSGARKKNQTLQYLRKMNPEIAQAVDAGLIEPSDAFALDYKQKMEARQPHKPNLMGAGGSIYNADTGQWITPTAAQGSGELGLNVIYGRDAQGNTVAYQASKAGGLVPVQAGEGVQLSDPYQRAFDTKLGGSDAERAAALPQVEGAANQMISTIDSLANDPYLNSMVGSVEGRLPNLSSNAARVQSKMDQLQGQSFLQAFNTLRGGGQITEVEGAKATQAIARLNTAQTEKDYRDALVELRQIVETAAQRAKSGTGGSMQRRTPTSGNRTSSGVGWSVEP